MSIFGKLDAESIPSNPYWVEAGEYAAEVVGAAYKNDRDGVRQLVLDFEIDDENSQFNGSRVSKYFSLVDPSMTEEDFNKLPADEQKKIRKSLAAVKSTLCGNGRRKGLGVDPEELNDENWDPSSLKGKKVEIGVSNYGPQNQGVNVSWANLRDDE